MLLCVCVLEVKAKRITFHLYSVYLQTCVLFTTSKLKMPKSILYTAELSLPEHFDIPRKICIPQIPETQAKLTHPQEIKSANKTGNQ